MKIGHVSCNYMPGVSWRKDTPIEIDMDEECAIVVYRALIEAAKSAMESGNYDETLGYLEGVRDISEALNELSEEIRRAQEEKEDA